mgnify:FL=1
MDVDFKTVKALSSRTRIKILNFALENEATPTRISREIDRSKSTVSSHLEKLVSSGLLEKDSKEGRKRVVYRPTEKCRSIVEGKTRKVKFSVTSSIISALAGLALVFSGTSYQRPAERGGIGIQSAEAQARELSYSEPFLFISLIFFSISVAGLLYGLTLRSLKE